MLFSAVVDADFLDTEAFFDAEKTARRGTYPDIRDLSAPFFRYLERLQSEADKTPVNSCRAVVLRQCVERAFRPPGLFSLTVPTGGGKT